MFKLGGGTASWSSKKQTTVTKSTTEVEDLALSLVTSEAIWLKDLHNEVVNNKQ